MEELTSTFNEYVRLANETNMYAFIVEKDSIKSIKENLSRHNTREHTFTTPVENSLNPVAGVWLSDGEVYLNTSFDSSRRIEDCSLTTIYNVAVQLDKELNK